MTPSRSNSDSIAQVRDLLKRMDRRITDVRNRRLGIDADADRAPVATPAEPQPFDADRPQRAKPLRRPTDRDFR